MALALVRRDPEALLLRARGWRGPTVGCIERIVEAVDVLMRDASEVALHVGCPRDAHERRGVASHADTNVADEPRRGGGVAEVPELHRLGREGVGRCCVVRGVA